MDDALLFDGPLFTKLGNATVVELQRQLMDTMKALKAKGTPLADIDRVMLLFLNDGAYEKLAKHV